MTHALVALGSNLGDRHAACTAALRALARLPGTRLVSSSALRETAPIDAPPGSPDFLNGVALLDTELSPRELLDALVAIEAEHGRERSTRNAPRTLDLDLLLLGDAVVDEPDLVVPHPRMLARRFVLDPAADVAPQLVHPVDGRTLGELRDALIGSTSR